MKDWMLEAPQIHLSDETRTSFGTALAARDAKLLPADVPRWMFLDWVTRQGYLLHGAKTADIREFEPRTPFDLGPDEFSKRTGVFAASDALWPMMFALKDRSRSKRILSNAMQVWQGDQWSRMKYFLSFGPLDPTDLATTDGRPLMSPGYVYVLPRAGFEQTPAYEWPGIGTVQEAQWFNPAPVRPLMCVKVKPDDFPLPVRVHDADRVDPLSESDPWGFPWLGDTEA